MPAYMIVQIRLHADRATLAPYRDAVGSLSEQFGGRYLVAGGAKVETLEGTHDGRSLVIFEFPSMDALHSFWDSPQYAEVKKLREGLADLDIWAVPGLEPSALTVSNKP